MTMVIVIQVFLKAILLRNYAIVLPSSDYADTCGLGIPIAIIQQMPDHKELVNC